MTATTTEQSDYMKYRGKCKEMSEALCLADPTLTLVRGTYDCPLWGEQAHWWCKKPDGTIVDPTVKQFPTKGALASYIEYDGKVDCEYCGSEVAEQDATYNGHHAYCSNACAMRDVGL